MGMRIMLEFCPHCGQLGGLVQRGQAIVCTNCGKQAGVQAPVEGPVIDQADELIRQGTAARCPLCQQLVELRGDVLARHYLPATRKLCPGSSKSPAARAPAQSATGKDLSRYMTRESLRVISCGHGTAPRIEELSLAYLDKRDRVRVQIDALRDILGPNFRMRDYPQALGRPELAVWSSPAMCVVGKKHEQGGCQPMSDAEVAQVVADLKQHAGLFFA